MTAVVQATLSIRDEKGATGRVIYYTDLDSFSYGAINDKLTDLREYFQEVATRLDALITGAIVDVSLTIPVDLPSGIKLTPAAASDVRGPWHSPNAPVAAAGAFACRGGSPLDTARPLP